MNHPYPNIRNRGASTDMYPRTMREAFGHEGHAVQGWTADNADALVGWTVAIGGAIVALLIVF